MVSNQKLFSVGHFDFRLQHLLIIGILAISVSISMLLRVGPLQYGFELFEFDPFFNYRATNVILENGISEYINWTDEKSWHPFGRSISETSQVTLHITTAILYQTFGFGSTLYDFTIMFPLVIGALTAIPIFAFIRVLGGTTSGLFAALIFSVSMPIITRGFIGWFKSEPLGIFLAIIAMYLFVSATKFNKGKISLLKIIFAGLFLALGVSAWGGILFFVIAIGLYYFAIPFVRKDTNFMIWAIPSMSISLSIFSLLFERSSAFLIGQAGLNALSFIIILPTIFVFTCEIIKKFSSKKTKIRNSTIFLISIIVSGLGIILSGLTAGLPTFRYLNAINPFLLSQDTLTDSVAEHSTTNLSLSFTLLSFLIVFALIGIWFLFSKKTITLKTDMRVFALIFGIIAIYISSAFVRLELFASIGVIILGSIGLAILSRKIFEQNNKKISKIIFPAVIILLFCTPVIFPAGESWVDWTDFTPTILSGGSQYRSFTSDDWSESMNWVKENTPKDSVIAAWWDYGYWITTLSERTTIIDNATLIDWQIKKLAFTFMTSPDAAWHILGSDYTKDISKYLGKDMVDYLGGYQPNEYRKLDNSIGYMDSEEWNLEYGDDCKPIFKSEAKRLGIPEKSCNPVTKGMDADYVLIYLNGERFFTQGSDVPLYTLEGGGDDSKKSWFAKISNRQVSQYVQSDGITPTQYLMEETLFGKLTPFSIIKYVEPNTGRTFDQYYDGFIPVYVYDLKYDDPNNDPFFLVYASPSFYSSEPGIMSAILIYKINQDYIS